MHINADLAMKLKSWSQTGNDPHEILTEAKRKGLVTNNGDALAITPKGQEFISKWSSGKPENTYVRKPNVEPQQEQSQRRQPFENQRQFSRQQGRPSFR